MGRSGVGRRVLDLAADAAAAEAATMQPKAEEVKARRSWLLWEEATPRQRLALPRIASPRLPSPRPEGDFSTLHELQPTREKRDPSLFSGAGHGITPLGPAKSNPNSKVELHRPTAAAPTPRPHRWQPQAGAALARRRAFLFVARSSSAQQQELSFIWARASAAAFRSDGGASTDNTHARADRIQARAAIHRSPLPSGRLSGKTASIAQRSARVDRKLRGVKVGKRKLSMVLSLQQACDRRLASATSARAPVTLGEQSSAA
ncbi:uncharacterized protein PAN0_002c0977 [Moesziomyces antarcticus]|uniref:Uncharacterized protein n=1 Tax=Pseudozyma antarctica TaxID=84753 RepID=A0A5C3FHR8_PSEA2|nr:uncharacterized protein PAN0_002c0977 [Moesziomyces antarcticus]GAK62775.1 hypothetical protein PAN0_002c0977 [Moesziomyces antarcticus]SPO43750.1 uncharacterized protein PSANT_01435 [Moesziomyces antarcticus]